MTAAGSPLTNSLKRRRITRSALETLVTQSKTTESTPSKRRRLGNDAADIYDDIEGAHATETQRSTKQRSNGIANGFDASAHGDLKSRSNPRRGRRSAKEDHEGVGTSRALGQPRPHLNGSTPQKKSPGRLRSGNEGTTTPASRERNHPSASSLEDELASPHKASSVKRPVAKPSPLRNRLATAGNGAISKGSPRNGWPDRSGSDAEQDLLDMQLGIDSRKATGTPRAKLARTTSQTRTKKTHAPQDLEDDDDDDDEGVDLIKTSYSERVNKHHKAAATLKGWLVAASPQSRAREQAADEDPEHLEVVQRVVLSKITSRRPVPLTNLDEEYSKVHSLLLNTVVAGEGNSMLLIGARGSGKSALVEKALRELDNKHAGEFHVVRLSGFFQTDDKIALKEIWRQLGREMEVEDDTTSKSYADTLATLLALLSQPTESGANAANQVAKAIIFIMDEFDLFASHPRQTLLYNLFDIAQSRKAPIAVLGMTTRIDVSESLEKRVKSRFSHRYVHISLPKTFSQFQEVCKAVLLVQSEELNAEEKEILKRKPDSTKGNNASKRDFLAVWNAGVEALFKNPQFLDAHLAPLYYLDKSVPSAMTSFHIAVASINPSSPVLTASSFSWSDTLLPPDSKLAHLPALPTLALSLLIASARLDIIHNTSLLNFNMAYAEYSSLAAKARIASAAAGQVAVGASGGAKVYGREIARREWERLLGLELLLPVVGGAGASGFGIGGGVGSATAGGASGSGGGWATQMMRCDVALEEIAPSVPKISKMLERWCKQI